MVTVNGYLFDWQLFDVLSVFFETQRVRIIRVMAETGRNKICWVYLEDWNGNRRATFLSRKDLNLAFLEWRRRKKIKKIKTRSDYAVSYAMIGALSIGETVWSSVRGKIGKIIDKGFRDIYARVTVDWGNFMTEENPLSLDII